MEENTQKIDFGGEQEQASPSPGNLEKENKMPKKKLIGGIIAVLLLGVVSGYGLFKSGFAAGTKTSEGGGTQRNVADKEQVKKGMTVGVEDEKTFTDTAEGKLEKGGIDGEGSHHLVRPGGESQTVYLTSSIVDLDKFVGHKVKIWGETFAAQKAGWLMDVGRLEVLD